MSFPMSFPEALAEELDQMRERLAALHAENAQLLHDDNERLQAENICLKKELAFLRDRSAIMTERAGSNSQPRMTAGLGPSCNYQAPIQPLLAELEDHVGPSCNSQAPVQPLLVELEEHMPSPNANESNELADSQTAEKWELFFVSLTGKAVSKPLVQSSTMASDDVSLHLTNILSPNRMTGSTLRSVGWSALVSPPWSLKRILMDSLSLILVSYDSVMLPLGLAFGDAVSSPGTRRIDFAIAVFWACDLPMQFFVGFYNRSSFLEMRPFHTARHYVQRWFLFDVTVLLLDWYFLISSTEDTLAKASRAGKGFRAIRCLRAFQLLRLRKVTHISNHMSNQMTTEVGIIVMRFVKLIVLVLAINHAIGCAWYALGNSDGDYGWVDARELNSRKLAYRYTTALHWSITQFTPASMEVFPSNLSERIFAICTVLFGLIAFSSIVSSITSLMVQIRNFGTERFEQEQALRLFLQENKISSELARQIWGALNVGALSLNARACEDNVTLLQYVPPSLRIELHAQMYLPTICGHPFFHSLAKVDLSIPYRMCHRAVSHQSVPAGFELFCKDETASGMSFLDSGVMKYSWKPLSSVFQPHDPKLTNTNEVLVLTEKEWVCEAALWTKWVHCGYLVARTVCEVFTINAAKFNDHFGKSHPGIIKYRAYFVDFLSDEGSGFDKGVSDFFGDVFKLEDMTASAFKGNDLHDSDSMLKLSALVKSSGSMMDSMLDMIGLKPKKIAISGHGALMSKDTFRKLSFVSCDPRS